MLCLACVLLGIWRSAFIPRLARMCTIAIGWVHGWACVWYWVGTTFYSAGTKGAFSDELTESEVNDTWLTAYYENLKDINGGSFEVTMIDQYLWSIYFTAVTFSTVGYGDITPQNYIELTLAIIYILVAFVFVSVLIAELVCLFFLSLFVCCC